MCSRGGRLRAGKAGASAEAGDAGQDVDGEGSGGDESFIGDAGAAAPDKYGSDEDDGGAGGYGLADEAEEDPDALVRSRPRFCESPCSMSVNVRSCGEGFFCCSNFCCCVC